MRVLLPLLLLSATLAGCASDVDPVDDTIEEAEHHLGELSRPIFDILPVEETWIAMDDGKRMHTAVFRPDTPANVSVPVFINFSPYWGDTAELRGDAFSQYMIDEYVPRGYAVVLAALRGTGHSEGCFSIGGDRELIDMHDVVDHFATAEWSNGAVATGGKSYDSSPTNGLIAKYPHPALKGVFHVSGITDMYEYNYHNGVPYATGPVFNTYYYLQGTDEYGVSLVGAGSHEDEDAESLARLIDDVACTDLPEVQAHGVGSGVTGLKTDYWIERDWARHIGGSDWNGSIFFVHGLQDWNVKPDHILPWIDNLPEQIRVKGWLHQGGHVYPERTDWNQTMLRWMDHELKGIETGFWDEPRWEVRSDDGNWYQHDAWPPHRSPVDATGTALEIAFDESTHVSGSIQIMGIGVTMPHNDQVFRAVVYARSGDTLTWLSEGYHRVVLEDDLTAPRAEIPLLDSTAIMMDTYPFDHVFAEGESLVVSLTADPRQPLLSPHQTPWEPASWSLSVPWANATLMPDQPRDMRCFAC